MERINIYNPDATLYLSNDIMNLMCGESHDDNERPLHDNVVSSVHIPTLNGGDW
jgi:hypothetical protein